MRNRYSVVSCCVLLSLVVVLDDAYAKKPQKSADVSAIYLDVLRVKACAVGQGCSTVGGPKQINLLEMAEGKTDFAKQVLMPAKTNELRLILGKNSTIAVDGQTYPLTVPSGQVSGLKLKGQKVFGKTGGFLADITLDFDLAKGVVVKTKAVKGKGKKDKDTVVYSYSLKPVIQVSSAEVTPMPENMAGVFVMPDESSKLKIGNDFLLSIPVGAVSAPILVTAEEIKYSVEVKDEATGQIVKKAGLASTYDLKPEGTQFVKPVKVSVRYHTDTLPAQIPESDLAVFHDGNRIPSQINKVADIATGDISHFSSVTASYGKCEDTKIEEGIIKRYCNSATSGYPDMYIIIADRDKIKDKYKLRILADDLWNGNFNTQTVSTLASDNNAIVAVNASKFAYESESAGSYVESSVAHPTYSTIMNNVLRYDWWGYNSDGKLTGREVFMSFSDSDMKMVKKQDFLKIFTLPEQINTKCSDVADNEERNNCQWAKSTESLYDSKVINDSKPFKFSSNNIILPWAVGSSETILERSATESTCKWAGKNLDEAASAIGYTEKNIIFVISDLNSYTDKQFDTYVSLCEPFKVIGEGKAQAVNLDGGCSSQLVIKGELTNGYCTWDKDGPGPRHVVNAIGLVPKDQKDPEPPNDDDGNGDDNGDGGDDESCPNGNGLYCGDGQLGRDEDTLYYCKDGEYKEQEKCSNGCQIMPAGTNDKCMSEPTSCQYGNGYYCGDSSLGQDEDTLYYCEDGHYDVHEQCSNGCQKMDPYVNDVCK